MFKVRLLEAKTLVWWYGERDNIELDPLYQRRGKLWSERDKAYLIDSILNDYDIPKIYLADFTYGNTPLNITNKSYAVIDGKQRLETIFDFFDGKIVLDSEFKLNNDPSLKLNSLGYKDLKSQYPKIASKFENFNLTVMGVQTDEENLINDLFVRLNSGKPLTGAEIRSAMGGKIPPLINNLVDHDFFKQKIRFSTSRKQDHNVVAKLLLVEFRGTFVDTKKIHLDRFIKEGVLLQNTNFESAAKKVRDVLNDMSSIFMDSDFLLRSSGHIVIYYWLFRNYPMYKEKIREFLTTFHEDRKNNRKLLEAIGSKIKPDEELINYDSFIRNPNDQGSIAKCYFILEKRLNEFIKMKTEKNKNVKEIL